MTGKTYQPYQDYLKQNDNYQPYQQYNQQDQNNQQDFQSLYGQQYNQSQYNQQQYPQSPYGQTQYGQQNQQNQQQNQQQNVIKNPKSNLVPKVKNQEMNDRDFVNDILATEKYLTDNFNVFTREASHEELYQDLKQILNETHDCARDLFDVMFQEGFYKLKPASQQEIQKTKQQFTNYLNTQGPY